MNVFPRPPVTPGTVLKALNLTSVKQLDRPFLLNPATIRSCVKSIDRFLKHGHLVHLHPGFGSLTSEILRSCEIEKADLIESQSRLMPYLQLIASERVMLHLADPVRYIWKYLEELDHFNPPISILSTMPSGPNLKIIIDFAERLHQIERFKQLQLFVFVQEEVAKRFFVQEGSSYRTKFSLMTQLHFTIDHLLTLSGTAFYPHMKVNVALLKLIPRPQSLVETTSFQSLSEVMRMFFQTKNKTILNCVKLYTKSLSNEKALEVEHAIKQSKVPTEIRPIDLSFEQIIAIAEMFDKCVNLTN